MSEAQSVSRPPQPVAMSGTGILTETPAPSAHAGSSPILTVENLSIRLLLHQERTRSLREYAIQLLKGRAKQRDEFWPLRAVSFTVDSGEILGIVGPNGAGKSTLLKVIAGIIPPSVGRVVVRGRIAPLIELGAGFDSELTGRENVYLYGALLGFSQKELEGRFARIVEFTEMEDFVDVPLKNYSVGMSARLGFAIATDVEPDLLLIDELFSVGDATFKKKCEKRMDAFKAKGVTIVVVSHDLQLIQETCRSAIWLHHGQVAATGSAHEVVAEYRKFSASSSV